MYGDQHGARGSLQSRRRRMQSVKGQRGQRRFPVKDPDGLTVTGRKADRR